MTYHERRTFKGRIRYANYRFRWWLARYITPRAPIHLDIEINSTCNLRCPICHQSDNPRVYELRHMDSFDVCKRLNEAKAIGVRAVKFNWRGEPLIHPEFWSILQHAFYLDFDDILINTNLSVKLDDDQIRTLARIPSLKVSIDSVSNYAKARRGGNLLFVMGNIERLLQYRDSIETNRHESSLTESFDEYVAGFIEHLGPELTARIKMHNGTAQMRNKSLGVFVDGRRGERVYCGMPSRRVLISGVTGKAYPCCVPYAEHRDMAIGGKNQSIVESWKNAERFRKGLKKNPAGWTKTCQNCASSDAWK